MAYVSVDRNSIVHNLSKVQEQICREGASLTVVTKFCTSDTHILSWLLDAGVTSVADSNMENFKGLPPEAAGKFRKTLIETRLSDIRSLPELPAHARPDRVFVSDEALLRAIAALPSDIRPEVTLVAEVGDLRDGFYPGDIPGIAARFPGVSFTGVSANFACLSGKMPDRKSIELLHEWGVKAIKGPSEISIGGTVVLPLIASGEITGLFTEVRLGEGIFFGYDSSAGKAIDGFERNAFTLYGEIVEIREKDVIPVENAGYTAFGGPPALRKTGKRRCAVLDFGRLAASTDDMCAEDPGVEAAGQTFDYTVVDITESLKTYKTGEYIAFSVQYAAGSYALHNRYVSRRYERTKNA